ncbi:MAG TPA: MOSC N-terminal beta barrel domain-containing protein [Candidatus Angelobacter sp.]|nr:MOSC N-terminal beta barrel domain-containing protein [Candidatus Angelobacter sp.]
MHVAELWRYPVKSLKGERIEEAQITSNGILGDREIAVLNSAGRVVTSRTRPKLLGLNGSLGTDGIATINGFKWDSNEAGELVNQAVGEEVRLVRVPQPQAFDVLPLLIATDGATQFLNIDHRRLRPNILLANVAGLNERDWPGRIIKIGDLRIQAVKLRARCVMTTFDPDTQEQDKSVLIKIIRDLDGTAALDCSVIQPGVIRVGDAIEIA